MEEFLPRRFCTIVPEAKFKQHGEANPASTDEQQPPLVEVDDLLPQHEKRPGEEGTRGKSRAHLVRPKLSYQGSVPFFSYHPIEEGHWHKADPAKNDAGKQR